MQQAPGNLAQWGLAGLAIGAVMVLAQIILEMVRHRRNGKSSDVNLTRVLDMRAMTDAMQQMTAALALLQVHTVELRAQVKELRDRLEDLLTRRP